VISLNSRGLQTQYSNSSNSKISTWGQPQSDSLKQIRLKLLVSQKYKNEPVLSRLVLNYGLIVNITGANIKKHSPEGWLDLELRGNIQQLQKALAYLQQLDLKILGKANPDRDSW
jgi:ABC-type methionine transport system ATPase subunit